EPATLDRVHVVTQQINLLQNRLNQSDKELNELQQKHDKQLAELTSDKVTKSVLDKSMLDIAVAKSNLDSVNIELADTQQTIAWLEKSRQEIDNQINVLSIFGRTITQNEMNNSTELSADSSYQHNLIK